ncbi:unnamed protein product [Rodentolepis nana]|uniref:Protein aurora borealis n=1 Tax=Rodentolepis nana TaxID=102285 RepID=A0A0R3TGG4_RODNA|nr:unnamed protein product [Rodentolepis nana]
MNKCPSVSFASVNHSFIPPASTFSDFDFVTPFYEEALSHLKGRDVSAESSPVVFSKASKYGQKKTRIQHVPKPLPEKCNTNAYAEKLSSLRFGQTKSSPQIYFEVPSSAPSAPNSLDGIESQFPILSALLDEEDNWVPPSKRKKTEPTHEEEGEI